MAAAVAQPALQPSYMNITDKRSDQIIRIRETKVGFILNPLSQHEVF